MRSNNLSDLPVTSSLSVQEGEQAEHGDSALRLELQQLQARRMLRTLAVVQDLADALLALNDVRGARTDMARAACSTGGRLDNIAANLAPCVRRWQGHPVTAALLCLADMQVKGSSGMASCNNLKILNDTADMCAAGRRWQGQPVQPDAAVPGGAAVGEHQLPEELDGHLRRAPAACSRLVQGPPAQRGWQPQVFRGQEGCSRRASASGKLGKSRARRAPARASSGLVQGWGPAWTAPLAAPSI